MKKFLQGLMLWSDNFFMKFKFDEHFKNYNFGFNKIIDIQQCSRLQEFLSFVNSASYVYLLFTS